jgi:uncharacterized Ntn-hydrolase superfamily protein
LRAKLVFASRRNAIGRRAFLGRRARNRNMTWSIIAREAETGRLGIALATRFFAAGARVPFVKAEVGAVATQALLNPFYGSQGLALLAAGLSPAAVIERLIAADDGRDHRQVHVMDAAGRAAAHTGKACIGWAGHLQAENISVAGNMLAGPAVIERTAAAYLDNASLPFPQRLIAAMQAGEAAGGDKRGKQSAALVIYGEDDWSELDLRVDDHPDPLSELARLERVSRLHWAVFRRFLPSRRDPVGGTDRSVIEAAIARATAAEANS